MVSASEEMDNRKTLHPVTWSINWFTAIIETSMAVPQKKLKTESPYNPSIPLLGIYPKEMKSV
jgi:hypothetical protein